MVNEEAIHQVVKSHGFEVVAMETHSLDVQLAIAANATSLIGPHGAGLANMIFAARNANVLEMIPSRYMTPLFRQLAIDSGHHYGVLIGEVESDSAGISSDLDWTVCPERVDAVLSQLG